MKVTVHCQMVPDWVPRWLRDSGATHVKFVGDFVNINGVTAIGRAYWPQGDVNRIVAGGKHGADEYSNWLIDIASRHPYIKIWESPNEPSIWNAEVLDGFAAFTRRFTARMHREGLMALVGQINTGWPNRSQINKIGPGLDGADGLGLHEYACPELWNGDGWQTLRYRRTREWLLESGFYCPPIYITELGIDSGAGCWDPSVGHLGWRSFLKPNKPDDDPAHLRYARQLAWYEREIQKDDYVVCAAVFTAGPYSNPINPREWLDFDVTEDVSYALIDLLGDG